jgi:hypothetical protein
MNSTCASRDPDPLIGEAVADNSGVALSRAAFLAILDGQTPILSDLVEATAPAAQEVNGLIGRELMVDDAGRVVAAHGLSLVPARQHRLTMGERQFWTWCALDVIGIPAGLAADRVAETSCHVCGTAVRVDFHAGEIHAGAREPQPKRCQCQRRYPSERSQSAITWPIASGESSWR